VARVTKYAAGLGFGLKETAVLRTAGDIAPNLLLTITLSISIYGHHRPNAVKKTVSGRIGVGKLRAKF